MDGVLFPRENDGKFSSGDAGFALWLGTGDPKGTFSLESEVKLSQDGALVLGGTTGDMLLLPPDAKFEESPCCWYICLASEGKISSNDDMWPLCGTWVGEDDGVWPVLRICAHSGSPASRDSRVREGVLILSRVRV